MAVPNEGLSGASPDGGWGWVVVASSFVLQLLSIGVTYSFGILMIALTDDEEGFGSSKGQTAWIGSIQPCLLYFTGLVSGPLIQKFGWRAVTICGSILSAAGFLGSSFASNVYTMYATYGVVTGIGNGLMYVTSMVTVQHYFERRRALATGLAVSGSGVGTLVFGFLTQFLIDNLGWRNAVRIESGVMLLGVICGAMFRPLPEQEDERSTDQRDLSIVCSEELSSEPEACACARCSFIDLSLCRKPTFIFYCLATFLFCFGYHVPYTYTSDRALDMGVDRTKAAFLVSIIGISNVAGRLVFGWFGDKNETLRFYLGGATLFLGGTISCCISLFTTYPLIVIYCVLFGAFTGCWVSLFPVILVDLLGVDTIETSLGQVLASGSFAFLVASPMSGFIIDQTGSYDTPYWVVGTAEMVGALFYFCTRLFHRPHTGYESIPSSRSRRDSQSRRSFMTESFS